MNPWYVQLVDDCLAEHDRICLEGAECPERETHTTTAYVYVALRERVEALQGQVARTEARIQAVRELHREFPLYAHEDTCPDTSDAHREEHHHEYADYIGEFYCDQLPDGSVCSECLDVDDNHIDWPCPTIRALGEDLDSLSYSFGVLRNLQDPA